MKRSGLVYPWFCAPRCIWAQGIPKRIWDALICDILNRMLGRCISHYCRLLQHPGPSFNLLQCNKQNILVRVLIYCWDIEVLCLLIDGFGVLWGMCVEQLGCLLSRTLGSKSLYSLRGRFLILSNKSFLQIIIVIRRIFYVNGNECG